MEKRKSTAQNLKGGKRNKMGGEKMDKMRDVRKSREISASWRGRCTLALSGQWEKILLNNLRELIKKTVRYSLNTSGRGSNNNKNPKSSIGR
jgi:hypothetical protein